MNVDKDYYAVLGVHPSSDSTALAAAYRALLKKYHPDVYPGSNPEAERITREINEAYEVLGDASTRSTYDARRNGAPRERSEGRGLNGADAVRWRDIVERYPEAERQRVELSVLSPSLASSYQEKLIETKDAKSAAKLAANLQAEYLTRHFGKNRAVQEFVLDALKANRRDVALEVNRTVKRFGPPIITPNFLWRISRVTGWQSPRYPLPRRQRSPSRTIGITILVLALIIVVVAVRH